MKTLKIKISQTYKAELFPDGKTTEKQIIKEMEMYFNERLIWLSSEKGKFNLTEQAFKVEFEKVKTKLQK